MALTEELKSKLNSEQLVIAEKWEAERFQRLAIFSQVEIGILTLSEALDRMNDITPEFCEHNRSIMSTCMACEEIERIIRPEAFEDKKE